jgi:hypothetical protein
MSHTRTERKQSHHQTHTIKQPAAKDPIRSGKAHQAIAGAIIHGDQLDDSAIPAKALKLIGSWTDTTFGYFKARVGRSTLYVHADDMLGDKGRDEGFIAATAGGKLAASGQFSTDDNGNAKSGSFLFDKKPSA